MQEKGPSYTMFSLECNLVWIYQNLGCTDALNAVTPLLGMLLQKYLYLSTNTHKRMFPAAPVYNSETLQIT